MRDVENHPDYNLDIIDIRLESLEKYVKYLKHLKAIQLAQSEMNAYNILEMVVKDLEKALLDNFNKKKI
jgi:hypothetical protein